ncbi:hypothetical protein I6M64_14035 [Acinetobacter lactucae]|uniref:Uncharacterized protein n=1 Tax=Acinetobacter lactucae TaxID=1785128 RepID=A0ABS1AKJ2_9GAMM|nr:hypothetical protein [Acinetobacter lactucae]MBJ8438430.1 hypothetical protein [Acinetobacter lactucae]
MTFILAIQLNDSIIIAADNKRVTVNETLDVELSTTHYSKLYAWEQGIITGTGESRVVQQSVDIFKNIAKSKLITLPECLDISKRIRTLELGQKLDQVHNGKLLCSSYSQSGAQLYKIERFDKTSQHTLKKVSPMEIIIWLFHPNVDLIADNLNSLYFDLKDYSFFSNQVDWINYYINRLTPIYQKQSEVDPFMSQSFDIFFQTKDEHFFGHIPNTQNIPLSFTPSKYEI